MFCQTILYIIRTWNVKPMEEKDAQQFRDYCSNYGYPSHLIVPHASYLLNCGSPNKDTFEKSKNLFLDGMKRCELLGIDLYNFHPGSTCGNISKKDSIAKITECINYCHSHTNNVVAGNCGFDYISLNCEPKSYAIQI